METALAILMVLGIYIGVPAAIGLGIVGVLTLTGRRARRAQRAKLLAEAEALAGEPTTVQEEATTKVPVARA